jgi:CHAD domain-containing protein
MKATPSLRASRLSGALEKVLRRVIRSQKLARDLDTEPIHDFRVALRRCRSLAEGFAEMDPRPVWRALRKVCAKQQSGLSELRDSQVLAEWVERLGLSREPDGKVLVAALEKAEGRGRRKACASLESFSRKEWKGWRHALPGVAGSLPVGRSRLARIAFDRATEVCLLERRWRRTRSGAAWHRLRLAVKRFVTRWKGFCPHSMQPGATS